MTGPDDPPPSGQPTRPAPGLQAERTLLAWSRTGLLLAVNATLVLRAALRDGQPALAAVGAMLALAACGLFAFGLRRRRQLEPAPDPNGSPSNPRPVGARALRTVAATVFVVAAACVWAVLPAHRHGP
ncbi:hypothetical protein GCM10009665_12010 [Kitasatospora nipponensis]|uniref:DUF202 domain-containing protein n=1 Tax=Kitasatospora nipponensis TaxID=258049 RepID=A0ABN1VWA5_9ACTN